MDTRGSMDTMYTNGVLHACVVPRPVVSRVHMVSVVPGLSEVPVVSWASVVSSFSDGYCSWGFYGVCCDLGACVVSGMLIIQIQQILEITGHRVYEFDINPSVTQTKRAVKCREVWLNNYTPTYILNN